MTKLLMAVALALGAHIALTYHIPARAGRAWVGWPFEVGDVSVFGEAFGPSDGRRTVGGLLAGLSTASFVGAILSLFGIWAPSGWWRPLAVAAAILSLALTVAFYSSNKLGAIAIDVGVIAVAAAAWIGVIAV